MRGWGNIAISVAQAGEKALLSSVAIRLRLRFVCWSRRMSDITRYPAINTVLTEWADGLKRSSAALPTQASCTVVVFLQLWISVNLESK